MSGSERSGLVLGGVAVALSAAACAFAARALYMATGSSTPSHLCPTCQSQSRHERASNGGGCVRPVERRDGAGVSYGPGQPTNGHEALVRARSSGAARRRKRTLRRQNSLPVLSGEDEEGFGGLESEARALQRQLRRWSDDQQDNAGPIDMLLEAGTTDARRHSQRTTPGKTSQPTTKVASPTPPAAASTTEAAEAAEAAEATVDAGADHRSAAPKRRTGANGSEASVFGSTGDESTDADSSAEGSSSERHRGSAAQSRRHWSLRGPSAGVLERLERSTSVMMHRSQEEEEHSGPPYRVFLIRHAESMANVDPAVYEETADHKIPLTDRGRDMAKHAGKALRQQFERLFGSPEEAGRIKLWVSPFLRTRQTAREILEECRGWVTSVRESPMLVEQDWGLFEGTGLDKAQETHPEEWQRVQSIADHQGKYWARFPLGESCFDVCMRVQALFPALHRDRTAQGRRRDSSIPTVVIVSHGITIRAFLMMWCQRRPEWFQASRNPPNCSIRLIDHSNPLWDAGYVFGGFDAEGEQLSEDKLNEDTALRFLTDRQLFSTCYDDLVDDMATWISDE